MQQAFNEEHGITPVSVKREVTKSITDLQKAIAEASTYKAKKKKKPLPETPQEIEMRIAEIEIEMSQAAESLDFETAIALRDEWFSLKKKLEEVK